MNKVELLFEGNYHLVEEVYNEKGYNKIVNGLIEKDDLIQQGLIGLFRVCKAAVKKSASYDSFNITAKKYIAIEMEDYINSELNSVKKCVSDIVVNAEEEVEYKELHSILDSLSMFLNKEPRNILLTILEKPDSCVEEICDELWMSVERATKELVKLREIISNLLYSLGLYHYKLA